MEEAAPSTPATLEGGGSLTLKRSQYPSFALPEFRSDASNNDTSISLRLNETVKKGAGIAKVNGKDEYSAAENWNYGDVFELYAGAKGEHAQFFAGRKLETWATWDQEWQQGAFQPRYMENRIRADQAGLAGFFFGANSSNFKATLGVLPLFIPDFGPHFYVKNNRFTSANPWFHPPTDTFAFRSGIGDIHHSVDHPETTDVIRHGGGAFKMEYTEGGYLARASYSYKPMPQFLLGFPSHGRFVQSPTDDHFDIEVHPRVAYDRVVSLDNLYTRGAWSFSGSVAYSNPDDPGAPEDWTRQEVRPATIFSGSIERRLGDQGPRATRVRLGFLKINGGDAEDSGPFAGARTLFERRYQFYEAYSFALAKEFHGIFAKPISTEARLIYDRMQGGGVATVNAGLALSKRLRAEIEADFIGLFTSRAPIEDGFIEEYRANDRFSLGMTYAF